MTTIIGIQHPDKVTIIADSQVTDDSGEIFNHPFMSKITRRGEFLVAGAGEVLPCDIAQHIWQPPKATEADYEDVYHFMIAKVMPSLRIALKNNGFNFDEENPSGEHRFLFLIAFNGEIFSIDGDCSVLLKGDGIYGIGSGSKYAMGAIYAGAPPKKAMEIASKLDAFTCKPFVTVEQEKNV